MAAEHVSTHHCLLLPQNRWRNHDARLLVTFGICSLIVLEAELSCGKKDELVILSESFEGDI